MSDITPQEIQKLQGTRLQETSPWESYAQELDVNMNPELAAEVAEYAQKRWSDEKPSNETLDVLAEQKEYNDELSEQYQWLTPDEYSDFEARIGRVYDHAWLINNLRKANIACWYTPHPHPDKLILLVSKNGGPRETACWVQYGQMPELSIMRFDDHGVPLNEKRRGWRTCLLQLILKGIITEQRANQIFGNPRQDKAFARYNSTLQAARNAPFLE